MAQWIGLMVSIKCSREGQDLGTFQGEISQVDQNKIVLTKAFYAGFPCEGPVQINSSDITNLQLIDKTPEEPQENSTITIAKPVAKRASKSHEASGSKQSQNVAQNRSKPIDIELSKKFEDNLNVSYRNNTPNKRGQKGGKQWSKGWRDEECFGSSLDSKIQGDFDFEKNLALFDKQALWEELNSQRPDVIKNAESRKKYRHDENVIATQPPSARQIFVPKQEFSEYVTDDGLIIPCISKNLRAKLFEAAENAGLTWDRRVELFGTAAAELSIQLIGGAHRLNPNNMHQLPVVVVLCGPHKQGAAGINTARQLASHGVRTIVYCTSSDAPTIKKELSLYMLTNNKVTSTTSELPTTTDLIICALSDGSDSFDSYPPLIDWVNKHKAPVLALDPPSSGTPGLFPKISLLPVLPLSHSTANGKLYLANLGFPVDIFKEVGIKYRSPFGPKNTISLHPNE